MVRVIHELLENSAARFPKKDAVFFKDETMTYEQIAAQSRQLTNVLNSQGIKKGDRVAFFMVC